MTISKQKQLISLLEEFFSEYDLDKRDFLNKNKVAITLKKELKKQNRWKNKPRGKPQGFV